MKRWALLASLLLFVALCGSIAYWGMQLFKPPLRPVAAPPQPLNTYVNLPAATNLFGGRAAPLAVASNFQLTGVVVSDDARDSVAILVADGKPPQAVRMNREIVPGVTVQEVHAQYVMLSEGGVPKRVELPVTNTPTQPTAPAFSLPPGQGIQPAFTGGVQGGAYPPLIAPGTPTPPGISASNPPASVSPSSISSIAPSMPSATIAPASPSASPATLPSASSASPTTISPSFSGRPPSGPPYGSNRFRRGPPPSNPAGG